MKYKVLREKYERYEVGKLGRIVFEAKNDVEALLKIHSKCGYGYYDEEGREFGDEGFEMPDLSELIEALDRDNGDGMDLIFEIENVSEGIILYKFDGFEDCL